MDKTIITTIIISIVTSAISTFIFLQLYIWIINKRQRRIQAEQEQAMREALSKMFGGGGIPFDMDGDIEGEMEHDETTADDDPDSVKEVVDQPQSPDPYKQLDDRRADGSH